MTKKQGLRMVTFLILLCFVCACLFRVFSIPKTNTAVKRYKEFYQEPENTIDGIILGTSVAYRGWTAAQAWNDYGMTVLPMATNSQPLILSTCILDEVRKTQDIKFAVIDLHGIRASVFEHTKESSIRWVTDSMKWSPNQVKTVTKVLDFVERMEKETGQDSGIDTKDFSFYFPFLKYHSRWEEGLTSEDFTKLPSTMKGIHKGKSFNTHADYVRPKFTDKVGKLSDIQQEVLQEILDYGKKYNIELIFISVPSEMSFSEQEEINAAFEMVQNAGCRCINMNSNAMYDELDIQPDSDMRDKTHLNFTGAGKVTKYLSAYIHEEIPLEDKRGNKKYASWDTAWKDFQKLYENGTKKKNTSNEKENSGEADYGN